MIFLVPKLTLSAKKAKEDHIRHGQWPDGPRTIAVKLRKHTKGLHYETTQKPQPRSDEDAQQRR